MADYKFSDLIHTEPYKHQVHAFVFAKNRKATALFMEQGTGKTLVSLALMCHQFAKGRAKKALIVAPNAVVNVWAYEIEKHVKYNLEYDVLTGPIPKREEVLKEMQPQKYPQVAITNYPGLREMIKTIIDWKPDIVILDESQKIKNRKSKQSKAAHRLANKAKYRLILTGSPADESPLHLWSQYRFLDPDVFGKRWKDFEDEYAVMGGYMNRQVVGLKNLDKLWRLADKHAFSVKLDDVVDMPETVEQVREVELTPQERKLYKQMLDEAVVTLSGSEKLTAPHVLTQLMKLQQITSGFLKLEDGDIEPLKSSKLAELETLLSEDLPKNAKAVIFARFTADVDRIAKLCKSLGLSAEKFTGKTPDRGALVRRFQEADDPRILVIQEGTGDLGLTLTRATYAIFYSKSHSFENHNQARARIRRIGQAKTMVRILLIAKDTIDEDIHKAVANKEDVSKFITRFLGKRSAELAARWASSELGHLQPQEA